jgi:hypothetical protein
MTWIRQSAFVMLAGLLASTSVRGQAAPTDDTSASRR